MDCTKINNGIGEYTLNILTLEFLRVAKSNVFTFMKKICVEMWKGGNLYYFLCERRVARDGSLKGKLYFTLPVHVNIRWKLLEMIKKRFKKLVWSKCNLGLYKLTAT